MAVTSTLLSADTPIIEALQAASQIEPMIPICREWLEVSLTGTNHSDSLIWVPQPTLSIYWDATERQFCGKPNFGRTLLVTHFAGRRSTGPVSVEDLDDAAKLLAERVWKAIKRKRMDLIKVHDMGEDARILDNQIHTSLDYITGAILPRTLEMPSYSDIHNAVIECALKIEAYNSSQRALLAHPWVRKQVDGHYLDMLNMLREDGNRFVDNYKARDLCLLVDRFGKERIAKAILKSNIGFGFGVASQGVSKAPLSCYSEDKINRGRFVEVITLVSSIIRGTKTHISKDMRTYKPFQDWLRNRPQLCEFWADRLDYSNYFDVAIMVAPWLFHGRAILWDLWDNYYSSESIKTFISMMKNPPADFDPSKVTIVIAGTTKKSIARGRFRLDLYGLRCILDIKGANVLMSEFAHDIWMALIKNRLVIEEAKALNSKIEQRATIVTTTVIEYFVSRGIVATDRLQGL